LAPVVAAMVVQMREPAPLAIDTSPTSIQSQQAMIDKTVATVAQLAHTTQDPSILQMSTILQNQPTPKFIQSVSDNLQAMTFSKSTASHVRDDIGGALPQIQKTARTFEPYTEPTSPRSPEKVSPWSPLAEMSYATRRSPEPFLSPSPYNWSPRAESPASTWSWASSPSATNIATPVSPWSSTRPETTVPTSLRMSFPTTDYAVKSSPVTMEKAAATPAKAEAGCGGKVCTACFNKTCQATTSNYFEAMGIQVNDYKPSF